MNLKIALLLSFVGLAIVALVGGVLWKSDGDERATIVLTDVQLSVRVADDPLERKRGLSGYTLDNLEADGMLFVFQDSQVREFWMKDMNFPLDVVWLMEGRVVGTDANVAPPKQGEEPARMSSDPLLADAVLELPAGGLKKTGIVRGMQLNIQYP